ncbi:MAG: lysophospholipid acyltransferase family protein [Deltaproteobacteria bacterium]|nr:lysophospholipid acyltransferase family protein [Deltaproteobacteria bacterium]
MGDLPRPTAEQLSTLRGFERVAFGIADTVNRRPLLKRASHTFLRTVGATWVHLATRNLLQVNGLSHLQALRPEGGVLLVCNHRSFFDLYVVASVLLRRTDWVREMFFPVRGDYFYQRPDGVVVNALMSAMAMYPPVMRQGRQHDFNRFTSDALGRLLRRPGTVVGVHPEGTRNKTGDPYTLLPAQPGVGQMAHQSRATVLPVWILGLGNRIVEQIRTNFADEASRHAATITLVFGEPVELSAFHDRPARLRTYKELADHLREMLMALGEEERRLRAEAGLPELGPPR